MLTRSATRKLAESPAKSIIINEELNSCDFSKSHQVNILYPHHEKLNDIGCLSNVNINVNINPHVKVDYSKNNSNDYVQVMINVPKINLTAEGNSLNTNIIYNISPSSSTNVSKMRRSKESQKQKRHHGDDYTNFRPGITSSASKMRNINGKRTRRDVSSGNNKTDPITPSKRRRQDKSDAGKSSCQKYLFTEELDAECKIDNSKRTLVVSLVPLSEEQIRAYTFRNENISESSSQISNASNHSDEEKIGPREPLKSESTDFNPSDTGGHIENCVNHNDNCKLEEPVDSISDKNQESVCRTSPENKTRLDSTGALRSKIIFGNTTGDWNDENFLNLLKHEDSILTDVSDIEKEGFAESPNHQEDSSLESLSIDVSIDRIVSLLASPERVDDVEEEYEKRTIPLDGNNSEKRETNDDMGEVDVNERGDSPDAVIDEELKVQPIKKSVSSGDLIEDGAICDSGVKRQCQMSIETFQEEDVWCRDKWEITQSELIQFQLKSIQKKLQHRSDESDMRQGKKGGLKRSRMSRTSENPSDDIISNIDSARKARRSKRHEKVEESLGNPGQGMETRRSNRKREIEKMEDLYESDVTTPRSTRANKLRKTTPDAIERKRKSTVKEMSAVRKSGKTPKKMAKTEEASEDRKEVVKKMPSSDVITSPQTSLKEDEVQENESGIKEASSVSSTPKIKSSKKLSRIKLLQEKVKEVENEETEMLSSPKKSPVKVEEDVTVTDSEFDEKAIASMSSPLRKKKEAAERLRAEEDRFEQAKINEEEVTLSQSPKKSSTPTKASQIAVKEESDDIEMTVRSTPKKTNATSSPSKSPKVPKKRKAESENLDIATSPKKRESKPDKSPTRNVEGSNVEMLVHSPVKGEKGKSPSKSHKESQEDLEENVSIIPEQKAENPESDTVEDARMNNDDVELSGESTDLDRKDDSPEKELEIQEDEGETESEAENTCSTSLPEESGKEPGESLKSVECSPKKKPETSVTQKNEEIVDVELKEQVEEELPVTSQEESKMEECEENNIKLADDFLKSISSKKIEVKGQVTVELKKRRKKKRRSQNESLKSSADDYIPLRSSGATAFSVVSMAKFKSSATRHPAFDLKRELLYGSRVKRVPYSQLQSYKFKEEARRLGC